MLHAWWIIATKPATRYTDEEQNAPIRTYYVYFPWHMNSSGQGPYQPIPQEQQQQQQQSGEPILKDTPTYGAVSRILVIYHKSLFVFTIVLNILLNQIEFQIKNNEQQRQVKISIEIIDI